MEEEDNWVDTINEEQIVWICLNLYQGLWREYIFQLFDLF